MRATGLLIAAAAAAAALLPVALAATSPQLFGHVGPDFSIDLESAGGAQVTRVDPGSYEVLVRDLSEDHNFHLTGPGVDQTTQVEFTGTVTWLVGLKDGTYTLLCDVHPTRMRRTFVSGNPPPPPPATTPKRLATVGPLNTISLRNASGAALRTLKAGGYSIVVRDRSTLHNFHLIGPGVNRKTGRAATGSLTWKVKLFAGTLRFFSDRSPARVRGSIRVI